MKVQQPTAPVLRSALKYLLPMLDGCAASGLFTQESEVFRLPTDAAVAASCDAADSSAMAAMAGDRWYP